MKTTPPTEEEQIMRARVKQACLMMDEDTNLRLLRDDYLNAEQDRLAGESLALLEAAITPEQFAAAKACAIARTKIRAFQASLVKMSKDARQEAENPQPTP